MKGEPVYLMRSSESPLVGNFMPLAQHSIN